MNDFFRKYVSCDLTSALWLWEIWLLKKLRPIIVIIDTYFNERCSVVKQFLISVFHLIFSYFCELVLTLIFPTGYTTGSAMYPTFSLLNHNCVCNTRTRKFIQDGNNIIELEAMVIIKKGEEICTRYE